MIDLTIDVCVLISGSGKGGDRKVSNSCKSFMKKALKKDALGLALDKRGKIRHQYESKLTEDSYGFYWLKEMASKERIAIVPWRNLDRGTSTALKEAHFDPEDYTYVITSASSECKTIATHDPDYTDKVRRILSRRIHVAVKWPQECIDCYCE